jgi:hypothetical protein
VRPRDAELDVDSMMAQLLWPELLRGAGARATATTGK